jgi:AbrB family looped-hinge helix DNA binding protein
MGAMFHTIGAMTTSPVQAKVTRNGQISLPAEIRRRWGAASVVVIDRGDYAIVRPVPDDVVAALQGSHAGPGPSVEDSRRAEREAERAAEGRGR